MNKKTIIAVNCPYSNLFDDLLIELQNKEITSEGYYYGYSFAQRIYLRNYVYITPPKKVTKNILDDYIVFLSKQSLDLKENHSYLSRFMSGLKNLTQNKISNKSYRQICYRWSNGRLWTYG